jgi:hypothetical protein
MKLTYEAILSNPDLLARVLADAKRERARELHRLIFAPIASFFRRPRKNAMRPKAAAALTVACG